MFKLLLEMQKVIGYIIFILFYVNSSIAQEGLRIEWPDQYNWELHKKMENQDMKYIEIMPAGENDTNWTHFGQMLIVKGVTNAHVLKAKDVVMDEILAETPDAFFTLLEIDTLGLFPYIIFKVENIFGPGIKGTVSKVYYIVQGRTALYVNFVAIRKKMLSKEEEEFWKNVFKSAQIIYHNPKNKNQ